MHASLNENRTLKEKRKSAANYPHKLAQSCKQLGGKEGQVRGWEHNKYNKHGKMNVLAY